MERSSWLYHIPPWRMPRIRTHHYHHGHHTETTPVIKWLVFAYVFAIVWLFEAEIWLMVWFYYGLFLGLRWCWRHNPIGQTIDSRAAQRERQQPAPYDPHGAPKQYYDLGRLGDRGDAS